MGGFHRFSVQNLDSLESLGAYDFGGSEKVLELHTKSS